MEIGFAFGVSTAYIMSATNAVHYAIDPFQNSEKYNRSGLKNIEKVGLKNNLKYIAEYSCLALPILCKKNLKFDFVFVDGSHKFDDQFVDFYYIDLLLAKNGFVVFHDTWTPQIKTLLSWIKANKTNYISIKTTNQNFAMLKKLEDDKRKWFEFKKFEIFEDGKVSRYM